MHAANKDINKIINSLNTDKTKGPEIFIKLSANVFDSHLANILNKCIDLNYYSENAKIANVRPVFRRELKYKITD